MPIFRVQVNYVKGSAGKWSNVWHVSATDLVTAADAFEAYGVPDLLHLLNNACTLQSLLVSSLSNDDFITRPIGEAGTSSATGDLLPLFNSVKALFNDGSLGRPDYKYIKGLLVEDLQDDGVVDPASAAIFASQLQTLIDDMDGQSVPLVSLDNDQYVSASIYPFVQMRQMHRKRRKVVTP